ncbi:autophagy protein Apg5-domain-containing protein [Halteromyces radiatus]|uniref:autophagy protein Apg5-domain-containing protein n=1 Tax=Halteromyces radiatus TaxID=101107 RepID=UPI00221FC876|nr:autophagy protein Apg5-domain-containing protein [Halteromyces radiatus]KAI8097237.1 autophagy protein Apg5-domain-containing protein [Halteromyces radiatus]
MTEIDKDISKAIWHGKIPIQLVLNPVDPMDTLFMEVPRYSYLPLVTSHLTSQTERYHATDPHSIWYEYEGEPLKWHYPIGLLYDMILRMGTSIQGQQREQQTPSLPWRIIVHDDHFPETILLRNPGLETMQDMYMSMIKEADFLRHGSTKRVMNLSKQDQSQLWQALFSEKYEDYWRVNQTILDDRGIGVRSVPLRLYLPDQAPVIQDIAPFTNEKGDSCTLGDVLHSILPSLFMADYTTKDTNLIVVIHGIQLPLQTPIRWTSDHLAYPDNFLHLVICKSS